MLIKLFGIAYVRLCGCIMERFKLCMEAFSLLGVPGVNATEKGTSTLSGYQVYLKLCQGT